MIGGTMEGDADRCDGRGRIEPPKSTSWYWTLLRGSRVLPALDATQPRRATLFVSRSLSLNRWLRFRSLQQAKRIDIALALEDRDGASVA